MLAIAFNNSDDMSQINNNKMSLQNKNKNNTQPKLLNISIN